MFKYGCLAHVIVGFLVAVMAGPIFPLASASAQCTAAPDSSEDFGPTQFGVNDYAYTVEWFSVTSGCPSTTLQGFPPGGDDPADFTITPVSGKPYCFGYTWGGGHHAFGSKCWITITFRPAATGARDAVITPAFTNGLVGPNTYVYGAGFTLSPQSSTMNVFPLTLPSQLPFRIPEGFTSITFDSGDATVQWDQSSEAALQYQTSGGIPSPAAAIALDSNPFTTGNGTYTIAFGSGNGMVNPPVVNQDEPVAGGIMYPIATYDVGAQNDPVTDYWSPSSAPLITGMPIPNDWISEQLCSIYTAEKNPLPPTPGLLTLIAFRESSYAQFTTRSLYDLDALWPVQSPVVKNSNGTIKYPAGSFIGLMQGALSNTFFGPMDTAWDWVDNTQVGLDIFNQKIAAVINIQNAEEAAYPGLQDLTGCQLENMALLEYYGEAPTGTGVAKQYYTPQLKSGKWYWLINPLYVNSTTHQVKTSNYVYEVRNPATPNPTTTTCSQWLPGATSSCAAN
jgi:hypothetical protein